MRRWTPKLAMKEAMKCGLPRDTIEPQSDPRLPLIQTQKLGLVCVWLPPRINVKHVCSINRQRC